MIPTTITAVGIPAAVAVAALFRYLTFCRALRKTEPSQRKEIIQAIGQMNKDSRFDWPSFGRRKVEAAREDDETSSDT